MKPLSNLDLSGFLDFSADKMDMRLKARPSKAEFFALLLSFSAVGIFLWLDSLGQTVFVDLHVYYGTGSGNFQHMYYAYWILPFFKLFSLLPFWLAAVLWSVLGICAIWLASRVFGAKPALPLLTYQLLYILHYGQFTAWIVGGLALGWWALAHHKWMLAGIGFLLAATKFQVGIPFGLLLLLAAPISWKERLRVVPLPAIIILITLLVYPAWPLDLISRYQNAPAEASASIALWRWIGPFSLLVWVVPFILPLQPKYRFLCLAACVALGTPYFQQADLMTLFVFPLGWLPLIGNLGISYFWFGWQALQGLVIIPMLIYIAAIVLGLRSKISQVAIAPKNE